MTAPTLQRKRGRPAPRRLPKSRVAAKAVSVTAQRDPARAYPHLDALAALLAADSRIIRWNAIQNIALLAPVDTARKLDAHLDAYLGLITGGNLVSAANAIPGCARIARARPDLLERILRALLRTQTATYETPECRNVALGHVLSTLSELGPDVCRRRDVADFILRQRANTRAAVARRATRLAAQTA
jgi:hypothetical protein